MPEPGAGAGPLPAGWIRATAGAAAVLFGGRHGGVSSPPFDSANAGYLTGDDRDAVTENRRRLGAALGGAAADMNSWTRMRQVHGARVLGADEVTAQTWRAASDAVDADGAVTTSAQVTLTVLTADCGPVAIGGERAVGLAHAGWRGVVGGVLQATVRALEAVDPSPLRAVIGPLARPCCYEFASRDLAPIVDRFGPAVATRTATGRHALDLPVAIRIALERAGVAEIDDVGVCTMCAPDYFSHRRDGRRGPTGRQATLAVVAPVVMAP